LYPPGTDKPTKESETTRQWKYAYWRGLIRVFVVFAVLFEVMLVGPLAPLLMAVVGIIYAIRRVRFAFDTNDRCEVRVLLKQDLRHDKRFLTIVAVSAGFGALLATGNWFPVWFHDRGGYLWWRTANGTGRILPAFGAFFIWIRYLLIIGIPFVTWTPLKILDWVFEIESVHPNYRGTAFKPATPDSVKPPVGERLRPAGMKPKDNGTKPEPHGSSAPTAVTTSGGAIRVEQPADGVIDMN
jgi:hypothetical protein